MTRRDESILIIEDDPAMLRGLKDNLAFEGYRVETASDGERGLDKALKLRPDLVLLDIMLPKINGYEICRLVRKQGLEMPVLMLTAKGQESDIVLGLNLGADDYMTKPFGLRELLARVDAMLRRKRRDRPAVHMFGEFRLNITDRTLSSNGHSIPLSPNEFRLLALFVTRPNRALTRTVILNQVWGYNTLAGERTVDRFVNALRKKIERDPRRPRYICTVREIGYVFRNE